MDFVQSCDALNAFKAVIYDTHHPHLKQETS